jgi:hypothetical protein
MGLVARGTLGKPITFFFTENGTDPGKSGEVCLETPMGGPIVGCAHHELGGLSDEDAIALWLALGATGSRARLLPVFRTCDHHPLLIRFCQNSRHDGQAGDVNDATLGYAAPINPINWVNRSRWIARRCGSESS